MINLKSFMFAVPLYFLSTLIFAQEITQSSLYQACLNKTEKDPKDAFEDAIQWQNEGGGAPARHCAATALMASRQYFAAAKKLEALAGSVKKGPRFKANILDQAANAWLLANNAARAEAAATVAISLTPDEPNILITRAQARAALGDYSSAKLDLNSALSIIPNHPTALVFRGTANRYLNSPTAALADINAALRAAPNHPEGLLERGILKRLAGDQEGARADWLKLLRGSPGSRAAAIARSNLEKMDLRVQ